MRNGRKALGCAAAVALTATTLLAGGESRTQGGGGGPTTTLVEHTSASDRDAGWKTVSDVVTSSAARSFRWSLPAHPVDDWVQRVTSADRAAYRVRSVQGRLLVDEGAGVSFDDDPLSPVRLPSRATMATGAPIRARRGVGVTGARVGTLPADAGTLGADELRDAIFETGHVEMEGRSWVERFGAGWLYVWRVRNGTDTGYEFDWPAAPVQGPDGWSGTVTAGGEAFAVRFSRARPRSESSPLTFTAPGEGVPDRQSGASAYRPAPRRGSTAHQPRGYPPAISICGEVDAALLSADPAHDALVVRGAGRPLVETESTVERIGERWGYVWRVRNSSQQDLELAWPGLPAEGGGWTVVVAAGSEAELRLLDAAEPFVVHGRVTFTGSGTAEKEFVTSAAAYVPRPDVR